MRHSQLARRTATAGVCIGVGAAAGIAGSAAAPSKSSKSAGSAKATKALAVRAAKAAGLTTVPAPPGIAAFKIGVGGPPVHDVEVVPNKAGDGFDTVTEDSGTVKSVSGQTLTITEGTNRATYATPSLTIPADADVQRNLVAAKLTDIQAGDHVDVSADSDGTTLVIAFDPKHWPPEPPKIAGCGKPGLLRPLPGGTTGPAGSVVVQSGKFAARVQASGSTVSIGGATGATGGSGVASATVVGSGGPGGVVVCSFKTP
jgi:hypothetical protein